MCILFLDFSVGRFCSVHSLLHSWNWQFATIIVKEQSCPTTAMQATRGRGIQLLLIFDLSTRWAWMVNMMPQPHFTLSERTPSTHWIRGCVGLRARSAHRGYRKNPLHLPGIETQTPGCPICSQVLYWLSYPGSSAVSAICLHVVGNRSANFIMLPSIHPDWTF
jgi:hypothetical protein